MAAVIGHYAVENCHVGGSLDFAVNRGIDSEPAVVGLLLSELIEGEEPCHLARVAGAELNLGAVELRDDRLVPCRYVLIVGDVAELVHFLENDVPSHPAFVGVGYRVVVRGALRHAGKYCHLTESEILKLLVEVEVRGSLDAVRLVAEPDLVEIKLEDLLLREDLLDVDGDEDFLDLALDGLLVGEEEVPCHLLGYGARALAYPS